MGLIGNLLRRLARSGGDGDVETRALPSWYDRSSALFNIAGFDVPDVKVNDQTALTVDAVWAAVDVITSAFFTLPAHVVDDGGERFNAHPVARLFRVAPNEDMTPASFETAVMTNALLAGRGYAYIEKRGPDVVGLWPLATRCTYPVRQNGMLMYVTEVDGRKQALRPDQVLDIPGMTLDGIVGLSPVVYLARELGLAIVATKFASKVFSNGGNLGGIIETPPMTDDQNRTFLESFRRNFSGLENSMKTAALPPGWKYHPNQVNPEDSQLLAMRIHQVRVVARLFKVPPTKLQDHERSTYSNTEQLGIAFRTDCMEPWVVRWEQEIQRKLFREGEPLRLRFNLDAMLRADTTSRYAAHNIGIQGGWLARNEVRAMENLPPINGGDTPLVPLNMGPSSPTGGGDPAKAATAPAPAPAPDPAADATRSDCTALYAETARRLVTKEINAIRRAAKKHSPQEFGLWLNAWMDEHRAAVRTAFEPVLKAAGSPIDAGVIAQRHVHETRAAINHATATGSLEALLADWSQSRPAAIATALSNPAEP